MTEVNQSVLYSSGDVEDFENTVPPLELGPFSQRKVNSDLKNLSWSNIQVTLHNSKTGAVEKDILKDVWGKANGGELSAIMGASGAGKTTLFNVLAGRARTKGRLLKVNGNMWFGDEIVDHNQNHAIRTMFAFVAQEDALHESSTPRQALRFSAKLRLPRGTLDSKIDTMVDKYLEELGLVECSDTIIGGGLKKGISGGEKRRVSIGVELITQPSIIFLDEPTSGLDSYAAKQVMKLLKKVAQGGNIVLFTIHQPSSEIFASFDRLILLHKGMLMYQGAIRDLTADLQKTGFPIPQNYNPADWILDIAQENDVKVLKQNGFFISDEKPTSSSPTKKVSVPERNSASFWTQLVALVYREKTSLVKNSMSTLINIFITSFLSLVFGVIFFQIGTKDRALPGVTQGQLGALINVNISTMMGQAQSALIVFASERRLFLREYSTGHYGILPYFLSHLASEAFVSFLVMVIQALIVYFMIGFRQSFFHLLGITFALAMTSTAVAVALGSFFSDMKAAESLFTLVVVPQMYFSGVFLAIELIPEWIRWSQYLCSLTYASRLSFAYEFSNCDAGKASENCDLILNQNGVSEDDVWWYWLALIALFVFFRTVAVIVLRQRGKSFS